ncbi:MAG: hypothetical protein ACI8P3_001140 [Saprospiraceae bacterium]|jgi:hypothetical protein
MRPVLRAIFILVIISITACLIKPPKAAPEPWTKLEGYVNNTNIRVLHATPNELYMLSDNEFARLGLNDEFVENRSIDLPIDFTGRPGVSDHSFYQMILNDSLKVEVNFHLTKNPDPVYKIKIDDYKQAGDAAFLPEGELRNTAAYNDDGTQFIIPVIQIPGSYYAFLLFDISLNLTNTEFQEVELVARINIADFPANSGNLNSVKYIDGFFYATSLHGAIRINPSTGTYEKILEGWMLDVFKYDNKIYATGYGNILFVSENNGQNFEQVDLGEAPPQIQIIAVINDEIFSRQTIGFPFNLIDGDFSTSKRIALNEDLPQDFSAYQDLTYFNGNYYLSVFKEIYFGPEVITE